MTQGGPSNLPKQRRYSAVDLGSTEAADLGGQQYAAQLFGPFQVSRDGVLLDDASGLSRKSVRTLLKWFLLNPEVRVESAMLKELLWPQAKPFNNGNRLHVTLHYVRHLLEPRLTARQPSSFICSDGAGRYWFDCAGRWQIDIVEVGKLRTAGRKAEADGEFEKAIDAYERVLEHYSRTFLPEDLFDDTFESFRAAHDVAHQDSENCLMRLYLSRGLHDRALPIALSVLERDPYSEEASIAAAEIRLLQGNVLAARAQLRAHLETVGHGLNADPSPAVLRLWERIERAS